jgi:periplasmic protein CpxP/Spy
MEEKHFSNRTEKNAVHRSGSPRRFLLGLVTGGLLGALLAGGIIEYSSAIAGPGFLPRPGHGGFCGRGPRDPQAVRERVDFASDWILGRINASEDQRRRIKGILGETMADLFPLGEQHQQNRQAMMEILVQPTVDRDALSRLRQSEIGLAEGASTRLLEAVAAAAEILTVEQRQELANLASRLHR